MRAKGYAIRSTQVFLFVLLAAVSIFPLLWAVTSSFRTDNEIFQYALPFQLHTFVPVHPTFDAYRRIFSEFGFQRPIWNTIVVSAVSILLSCIVNSMAAFGFATFRFKGKGVLYAFTIVSFMVPFEAIAIPLYRVVNQFKWVDTYQGLIAPTVADGLVLFLFVQFFKEVPASLYESARLDGATWRQVFLRILVPLSKPVFITAGLMVFINQWNSLLWPLVVAHGREMRLIQVALSDFMTERVTLWSCLYAASVVSALIPLVFFLPLQKYYVQGITSSGLKG